MMPIPIESHNTSTGEIRYGPANVRVRGVSQYNADQIAFEGIEGFWQLPKSLQDKGAPKDGTILCVWLKTKPKSDRRARPGSRYMDIVTVKRENPDLDITTDGLEHADGQPYESPRDAYREPATGHTATKPVNPYDERDSRISRAQAWNGLTQVLTAGTKDVVKLLSDRGYSTETMVDMWIDGFELLRRGQAPSIIEDEMFNADGNEIGPTQSGFDGQQHPPQPAEDADDVEELPW